MRNVEPRRVSLPSFHQSFRLHQSFRPLDASALHACGCVRTRVPGDLAGWPAMLHS